MEGSSKQLNSKFRQNSFSGLGFLHIMSPSSMLSSGLENEHPQQKPNTIKHPKPRSNRTIPNLENVDLYLSIKESRHAPSKLGANFVKWLLDDSDSAIMHFISLLLRVGKYSFII